MREDRRFELNVLFRGSCRSEIWVFICLGTICLSEDSLMSLTYIIYSFWLIFSFSQVKLTHSGSLCALLTPYMVVMIRCLRFVERRNKSHRWVYTNFFNSTLLSRRQTKPKEEWVQWTRAWCLGNSGAKHWAYYCFVCFCLRILICSLISLFSIRVDGEHLLSLTSVFKIKAPRVKSLPS